MLPQSTPETRALGLAALVLLCSAGVAGADVTKPVQKAFAGKILVTEDVLPDGNPDDDKDTIALYKRLDLNAVPSDGGDTASWTFNYTAFFRKPVGVKELSLDFHKLDKGRSYVANKRFGVDPKLTILSGRLSITEDDGPAPGNTYELVLRGKRGKREVELARTRLTLRR